MSLANAFETRTAPQRISGVTKNEKIEFVRANIATLSIVELAAAISKSPVTIRRWMVESGIVNPRTHRNPSCAENLRGHRFKSAGTTMVRGHYIQTSFSDYRKIAVARFNAKEARSS